MNGKFHMTVGAAAAGVIIATKLDQVTAENALAILGASTFASLLPDIDNCNSTLGRYLVPFRKWQGDPRKHRQHFPHKPYIGLPLFTVLFSALLIAIGHYDPLIVLGFFVGYFLHLVFDSYTPGGIPWIPGKHCISAAPKQNELDAERRAFGQIQYAQSKHPEMKNRWTNTSYAPQTKPMQTATTAYKVQHIPYARTNNAAITYTRKKLS